MLHISRKEMEKAFRYHQNFFDNSKNESHRNIRMMVLFYAVECGLKALYMRQNNLERTNQTNHNNQSIENIRHNLNILLDRMKIKLQVPKITTENNTQVEHEDLHTAWRYGKKLHRQKEQKCIDTLIKILSQLKNHL